MADSRYSRQDSTSFAKIVSIPGRDGNYQVERPFETIWIEPASEASNLAVVGASFCNDVEKST